MVLGPIAEDHQVPGSAGQQGSSEQGLVSSGDLADLGKFDKKALLKKVMPLLLDQMTKVIQLSVNVLPSILEVMER